MRKDGRTDGRTDMRKLTVAFRNFANAPKNVLESGRSLCDGTYRVDVSVHFTVGAQIFLLRDVKNACLGRKHFKFIYPVKVDTKNCGGGGDDDDDDDDDDNNNNII